MTEKYTHDVVYDDDERLAQYAGIIKELRLSKEKAEAERDKALDLRDSIERKLLCEVRDLREALEWYGGVECACVLDDYGKRARDVLVGGGE